MYKRSQLIELSKGKSRFYIWDIKMWKKRPNWKQLLDWQATAKFFFFFFQATPKFGNEKTKLVYLIKFLGLFHKSQM